MENYLIAFTYFFKWGEGARGMMAPPIPPGSAGPALTKLRKGRWFWDIFDLPTYPNQILYYISLFSKIRCSLTYLPIKAGHALRIWICGCSPFYKNELWASKSAGAHSTKSLEISGCKRWCPKDLRVCAPAAPVLTHSLISTYLKIWRHMWMLPNKN